MFSWSLGLDPKREIGKAEIFDGCAGEGVGGTRCGCAGAGSGVDFLFFLGGAEKVPVKMVLGSLKIMEITVWRAGGICIHGNQGCVMLVPGKT